MDVSNKVSDGERQFFFEIKEGYEVPCVKTLYYAKLLVGCNLYEI